MLTDPEGYTLNQWASNLLKESKRKRYIYVVDGRELVWRVC